MDGLRAEESENMTTESTGSSITGGKISTGTAPDTAQATDEDRDAKASKLVERFALWSGAAGLLPIPLVDVAAVGGLQLQMLRRLSQIYGVPFSANRGKSIIASLMGSMIPATSGMGAASALKTVPAIGTAVGTITMSGVSAAATYAIGKVFIQHFASGGTLLDFDPPDYRDFIKVQKERWKSRSVEPGDRRSATSAHADSVKPAAAPDRLPRG
jgi:uncharacterized protein (DUF697 family)